MGLTSKKCVVLILSSVYLCGFVFVHLKLKSPTFNMSGHNVLEDHGNKFPPYSTELFSVNDDLVKYGVHGLQATVGYSGHSNMVLKK